MSETAKLSIPHKMYVWRQAFHYIVVAHAKTVAQARTLALDEWKGDGDWSTPVISRAIKAIKETNPEIHYRENAEVVLCTSGEVEEQELYIDTLNQRINDLEKAMDIMLASAYPNPKEHPTMWAAWGAAEEVRKMGLQPPRTHPGPIQPQEGT